MPCIFCIAVFALLAGAITASVLDQLEARLAKVAASPVQRIADTGSVTRFEFQVIPPGLRLPRNTEPAVPVAVTVYKQEKRIRIQVLTHDISRPTAEAVEDYIAAAADLRILQRSDAHTGQQVKSAEQATPEIRPLRERSIRSRFTQEP